MAKRRFRQINKLNNDKLKSYFKRCGEDTPPFFKKLRNIGLIVAAAGAAVSASPIPLPEIVSNIAGYLVLGGTVATAISQATITEDCDLSDREIE